ncbi:hypothetical protein FRC06_005962, partial [Ceratobasidium sp. 370]
PIYPVPLLNGNDVPPGDFPATLGAFRELTGPALTGLLQHYGLAHMAMVEERHFWDKDILFMAYGPTFKCYFTVLSRALNNCVLLDYVSVQ